MKDIRRLILGARILVALASSTSIATSAYGQAARQSPIDELREFAQYQLTGCQFATKSAFSRTRTNIFSEASVEIRKCLENGKEKIQQRLPKAIAYASNTPSAVPLLQQYHASWLSALEGIMPTAGESSHAYQRRQQEGSRRTEDAWRQLAAVLHN